MLQLMVKIIESLPFNQKGLFDANSCLPRFINWNDFWGLSTIQKIPLAEVDPLKNVHIFYQDWVKSVQNNQYSEFMDLGNMCNW